MLFVRTVSLDELPEKECRSNIFSLVLSDSCSKTKQESRSCIGYHPDFSDESFSIRVEDPKKSELMIHILNHQGTEKKLIAAANLPIIGFPPNYVCRTKVPLISLRIVSVVTITIDVHYDLVGVEPFSAKFSKPNSEILQSALNKQAKIVVQKRNTHERRKTLKNKKAPVISEINGDLEFRSGSYDDQVNTLILPSDFETTGFSEKINNDVLAITPIPDTIKDEEPIPSLPPIKITLPISDILEKEQSMISNEPKKETNSSFYVVSTSSFEERYASIRSTTGLTNPPANLFKQTTDEFGIKMPELPKIGSLISNNDINRVETSLKFPTSPLFPGMHSLSKPTDVPLLPKLPDITHPDNYAFPPLPSLPETLPNYSRPQSNTPPKIPELPVIHSSPPMLNQLSPNISKSDSEIPSLPVLPIIPQFPNPKLNTPIPILQPPSIPQYHNYLESSSEPPPLPILPNISPMIPNNMNMNSSFSMPTNNPPPIPQIPAFNLDNTQSKSTDTPKISAPTLIMSPPPIPQLPTFSLPNTAFSEMQKGPSFPTNGLIQQPFALPTLPSTNNPFTLPDFSNLFPK